MSLYLPFAPFTENPKWMLKVERDVKSLHPTLVDWDSNAIVAADSIPLPKDDNFKFIGDPSSATGNFWYVAQTADLELSVTFFSKITTTNPPIYKASNPFPVKFPADGIQDRPELSKSLMQVTDFVQLEDVNCSVLWITTDHGLVAVIAENHVPTCFKYWSIRSPFFAITDDNFKMQSLAAAAFYTNAESNIPVFGAAVLVTGTTPEKDVKILPKKSHYAPPDPIGPVGDINVIGVFKANFSQLDHTVQSTPDPSQIGVLYDLIQIKDASFTLFPPHGVFHLDSLDFIVIAPLFRDKYIAQFEHENSLSFSTVATNDIYISKFRVPLHPRPLGIESIFLPSILGKFNPMDFPFIVDPDVTSSPLFNCTLSAVRGSNFDRFLILSFFHQQSTYCAGFIDNDPPILHSNSNTISSLSRSLFEQNLHPNITFSFLTKSSAFLLKVSTFSAPGQQFILFEHDNQQIVYYGSDSVVQQVSVGKWNIFQSFAPQEKPVTSLNCPSLAQSLFHTSNLTLIDPNFISYDCTTPIPYWFFSCSTEKSSWALWMNSDSHNKISKVSCIPAVDGDSNPNNIMISSHINSCAIAVENNSAWVMYMFRHVDLLNGTCIASLPMSSPPDFISIAPLTNLDPTSLGVFTCRRIASNLQVSLDYSHIVKNQGKYQLSPPLVHPLSLQSEKSSSLSPTTLITMKSITGQFLPQSCLLISRNETTFFCDVYSIIQGSFNHTLAMERVVDIDCPCFFENKEPIHAIKYSWSNLIPFQDSWIISIGFDSLCFIFLLDLVPALSVQGDQDSNLDSKNRKFDPKTSKWEMVALFDLSLFCKSIFKVSLTLDYLSIDSDGGVFIFHNTVPDQLTLASSSFSVLNLLNKKHCKSGLSGTNSSSGMTSVTGARTGTSGMSASFPSLFGLGSSPGGISNISPLSSLFSANFHNSSVNPSSNSAPDSDSNSDSLQPENGDMVSKLLTHFAQFVCQFPHPMTLYKNLNLHSNGDGNSNTLTHTHTGNSSQIVNLDEQFENVLFSSGTTFLYSSSTPIQNFYRFSLHSSPTFLFLRSPVLKTISTGPTFTDLKNSLQNPKTANISQSPWNMGRPILFSLPDSSSSSTSPGGPKIHPTDLVPQVLFYNLISKSSKFADSMNAFLSSFTDQETMGLVPNFTPLQNLSGVDNQDTFSTLGINFFQSSTSCTGFASTIFNLLSNSLDSTTGTDGPKYPFTAQIMFDSTFKFISDVGHLINVFQNLEMNSENPFTYYIQFLQAGQSITSSLSQFAQILCQFFAFPDKSKNKAIRKTVLSLFFSLISILVDYWNLDFEPIVSESTKSNSDSESSCMEFLFVSKKSINFLSVSGKNMSQNKNDDHSFPKLSFSLVLEANPSQGQLSYTCKFFKYSPDNVMLHFSSFPMKMTVDTSTCLSLGLTVSNLLVTTLIRIISNVCFEFDFLEGMYLKFLAYQQTLATCAQKNEYIAAKTLYESYIKVYKSYQSNLKFKKQLSIQSAVTPPAPTAPVTPAVPAGVPFDPTRNVNNDSFNTKNGTWVGTMTKAKNTNTEYSNKTVDHTKNMVTNTLDSVDARKKIVDTQHSHLSDIHSNITSLIASKSGIKTPPQMKQLGTFLSTLQSTSDTLASHSSDLSTIANDPSKYKGTNFKNIATAYQGVMTKRTEIQTQNTDTLTKLTKTIATKTAETDKSIGEEKAQLLKFAGDPGLIVPVTYQNWVSHLNLVWGEHIRALTRAKGLTKPIQGLLNGIVADLESVFDSSNKLFLTFSYTPDGGNMTSTTHNLWNWSTQMAKVVKVECSASGSMGSNTQDQINTHRVVDIIQPEKIFTALTTSGTIFAHSDLYGQIVESILQSIAIRYSVPSLDPSLLNDYTTTIEQFLSTNFSNSNLNL